MATDSSSNENRNKSADSRETRAHLSTQVRLIEAIEHLRQARETLPEEERELADRLDALVSDTEIARDLSEARREDGESRWYAGQV